MIGTCTLAVRAGCAAMLALATATATAQTRVTICADPNAPAMVFWDRDEAGVKTGRLVGFYVDLVSAAFERAGVQANYDGSYPWVRCLKMVEDGLIDFALGGFWDEDRARRFAFTRSYLRWTPQVFFDKRRPLTISSTADLRKYRGCGVTGFSYAHYGLRPADLDLGVTTFEQLVKKLEIGRCDYFVEELETFRDMKIDGVEVLKRPNLGHGSVPGAQEPTTHLLTRKGGPGEALIPEIDRHLTALIDNGQALGFWRRYLGNEPYRP